jgi:excisionase family DNA binding protein
MGTTTIDWRTRPAASVAEAAELLICSKSQLYAKLKDGTLEAVDLFGKTGVTTESIKRVHEAAKPKTITADRVAAANAARLDGRGRA